MGRRPFGLGGICVLFWAAHISAVWAQDPAPDDSAAESESVPFWLESEQSAAPAAEASQRGDRAFFSQLGGVQLEWGGMIQSEFHYRIQEIVEGPYYNQAVLPEGFIRNENRLKLKLNAKTNKVRGVVDVDFVWLGMTDDLQSLDDLAFRDRVDPFRFEVNALYFEVPNLGLEGLDLRIGQQIVKWGVGDQFNPTNTINPMDLQNVLLFGKQQANLMARVDYSFLDFWSTSLVVVPVFQPALLPQTAALGQTNTTMLPFLDPGLRYKIQSEQYLGISSSYPTVVQNSKPNLPERTAQNMQIALRLAGNLLGQDIALSYYRGFADIPQALANHTVQVDGARCDPGNASDCIDGILSTQAQLAYPQMHVLGLNMSGELDVLSFIEPSLAPIGYRLELGIFFPQKQEITLTQGDLLLVGQA